MGRGEEEGRPKKWLTLVYIPRSLSSFHSVDELLLRFHVVVGVLVPKTHDQSPVLDSGVSSMHNEEREKGRVFLVGSRVHPLSTRISRLCPKWMILSRVKGSIATPPGTESVRKLQGPLSSSSTVLGWSLHRVS